jgi:hypothetical protein
MQISVGCVRARFAKHIAVLILIDACASALGFYLFGFAFAFGDGTDADGNLVGNQFIGSHYFAMSGLDGPYYSPATQVRPYAFWLFEWAVRGPPSPLPAMNIVPGPDGTWLHNSAPTREVVKWCGGRGDLSWLLCVAAA